MFTKQTLAVALLASLACSTANASSIRGSVWNGDGHPDCAHNVDADPSAGIEGIILGLFDANGDAVLDDGGDPITATTNANGAYLFATLPLGLVAYEVRIIDASAAGAATLQNINLLNRAKDDPALCHVEGDVFNSFFSDADIDAASVNVDMSGLTGCNTVVSRLDFAYCAPAPCTGSIGDTVWEDLNEDGVLQNGEPLLEGVRVVLSDANGEIADQLTNAAGQYLFSDLCAGDYVVTIDDGTVPAALEPCPCDLGDNNCSPAAVNLPADDASNLDVDFCYFRAPEPPGGGEGCTPGYWKNHPGSWPADATPDMLFSDIFDDAFPGKTLMEVVRLRGGGLNALGRHTVAALLNAMAGDVDYDLSPEEIINDFNEIFAECDPGNIEKLKDTFEGFNEQGCPLGKGDCKPRRRRCKPKPRCKPVKKPCFSWKSWKRNCRW